MALVYSTTLNVSGAAVSLVSDIDIASVTVPLSLIQACQNPIVIATIAYEFTGTITQAPGNINGFFYFPDESFPGGGQDFVITSGGQVLQPGFRRGVSPGHGWGLGNSPFRGFTQDPVLHIRANQFGDPLTVDAQLLFILYDAPNWVNLGNITSADFSSPDPGAVRASPYQPVLSGPGTVLVFNISPVYYFWVISGVATSGSPSLPTFEADLSLAPYWINLATSIHGSQWNAIGEYIGDLNSLSVQGNLVFGATSWAQGAYPVMYNNIVASSWVQIIG